MKYDIKAIPTKYDGISYRSRLEARWAVYFDHMQIPFEFELEGYVMPSGTCYLPDFYLTELGVFVEVKPYVNFSKSDLAKIVEFAQTNEKSIIVICGSPGKETIFFLNERMAISFDDYEQMCYVEEGKFTEGYFSITGQVTFTRAPLLQYDWTIAYTVLPDYWDASKCYAQVLANKNTFDKPSSF